MIQAQTVHHLVVVIARCLDLCVGKRVGVGTLEVDDAASLLIEERVRGDIVKGIVVVPDNLDGREYGPSGAFASA